MRTRGREDPAVSRAASALRNVEREDATTLVEHALEALHQVGHAEDVMFYRAAATDAGPVVARWAFQGSARGRAAMSSFVRAASNPALGSAILTAWDARRIRHVEANAFLESSAVLPREVLESHVIFCDFYAPNGIHDQQRLLVVDGERIVGWMGMMRHHGSPRFSSADRRRLASLVAPISALLVAAARHDESGPNEPGDLLVDPSGHVVFASAGGRAWLDRPGFLEELRAHVRAIDRGGDFDPETMLMQWAGAHCLRLDGNDGVRYLVTVRPPRPITLPASYSLSPAEREVAELARAGASAAEIAHERGTSVGTVRNQLKRIYAVLGVGSRVELAQALA